MRYLTALLFLLAACAASASTAITYQGQLQGNGSLVNGTVDLEFSLYDAETAGTLLAGPVSITDVPVTDGLFQVEVDFSDGAFSRGRARWLEVTVNGSKLSPRQHITPVPQALELINDPYWKLGGNAGTIVGTHFLGTTDDEPFELHVAGQRALRLEPTSGSPNVILGSPTNAVGSSAYGVFIAGGANDEPNTASGAFNTVGGGSNNLASGGHSTLSGGHENSATASMATVGGGLANSSSGSWATVSGGVYNSASGEKATLGGGWSNSASGQNATVPGGVGNEAAGKDSFAAGAHSFALHHGSFVWSDQVGSLSSTDDNQFLIKATGGVGVGTNMPRTQFDVSRNGSPCCNGYDPAEHAALIERSSSGGDVIALKTGDTTPGTNANFIGFFSGNDTLLGEIEGDGSGGVAFNSRGADFAEYLPKAEPLETLPPGSVVGLRAGSVGLATAGAHRVMVISTAPILKGNKPPAGKARDHALVAFLGQVPVRVRGAVEAGDFLVPSGRNDGTAVAAAALSVARSGARRFIGRALAPHEGQGEGRVRTLVGLPPGEILDAAVAGMNRRLVEMAAENDELRRRLAARNARLEQRLAQLEALLLKNTQVATTRQ